jgi:hypothetical protein
MGRRGEHGTAAARDESQPGVGAARVDLRCLSVLDSTAERLRLLDQILGARLEAEGSRLCRAVVDYVMTCFRSHDPAMSLEPVIAGLVVVTKDAAQEGVLDAVELVAERFQRDPAEDE